MAEKADRGQVLIQIVAGDQGEVSLEYLADLMRFLPPEEVGIKITWASSTPPVPYLRLTYDVHETLIAIQTIS